MDKGLIMDTISSAIIAAITSGILNSLTKLSEKGISDAYTKLKKLLKEKFGTKSEVVKSIKALEAKPDSPARISVIQEEIIAAKANQDPELLNMANTLLKMLKTESERKQSETQIAVGDQNVQISGNSNKVSARIRKS